MDFGGVSSLTLPLAFNYTVRILSNKGENRLCAEPEAFQSQQ